MSSPKSVRWMRDLLPEDQRYFAFLKKVARHELRKDWFRRLSTPILEEIDLFTRSIWEWTDVVDKEIYTLNDRKWRNLALKPEGTAWVMRSYIENDMQSLPQPVQLYYIEPHFRYDRPQKWRYRQFFQVWAEVIWEADPIIDAQCIHAGAEILDWCGLKWDYKIKINSIWNFKEREKYIEALKDFYHNKDSILCEDCRKRKDTNPLRLLDCKKEDCKILAEQAPKVWDFFKKDSKEFYTKLKEYLDILWIEYEEDHKLVRWLDYYCHTLWEYIDNSGRWQDALWWGGRYDGLAKTIGQDKDIPACGFWLWADRIINAMQDKWVKLINKDKIDLYIIQLWDEAKKVALPLWIEARKKGINTISSLWTPSLKVQLKKANRLWAKFVAIIGIMEAKNWNAQVKNMIAWTQQEVKQKDLIDYIINEIWEKNLDHYESSKDFIIEQKQEEEKEENS